MTEVFDETQYTEELKTVFSKIAIAGYGPVGKAHVGVMQPHCQIVISDPAYTEYKDEIPNDVDGIIICASTPSNRLDGSCDYSNVYDIISKADEKIPILIKSTISLEAWYIFKEDFPNHEITYSPEFLVAATATEDFKNTEHLFFGGGCYEMWAELFQKVFSYRYNKEFDWSYRAPMTLILGKYMRNSFLATKVAFFNQVYDLCGAYGIDYRAAVDVIASDPRIGYSHTKVTEERGFGGHCFPKDTKAIIKSARKVGVDLSLIKEAIIYNDKIRKTI